jgi:hypothetical protein
LYGGQTSKQLNPTGEGNLPTNQQGTKQMNNNKLFSTRLVNEYAAAGYFGEAPDTSEEEQSEIRRVWLLSMGGRGWILNQSVIDNENVDQYEREGQSALNETIEYLAGAF